MLIFDELNDDSGAFKKLTESEDNFTHDMNIDEIQSNESLKRLNELFESHMNKIEKKGKTYKLRVQYF